MRARFLMSLTLNVFVIQAAEAVNEAKKLDAFSINTLFMLFKLALMGSNVEQGRLLYSTGDYHWKGTLSMCMHSSFPLIT